MKFNVVAALLFFVLLSASAMGLMWTPTCSSHNICFLVDKLDDRVDELEDDFSDFQCSEDTYNTYSTTGGGIGVADLGRHLVGDKKFFLEHETLLEYLDERYMQKIERLEAKVLDMENRIYDLQSRAYDLEKCLDKWKGFCG